MIHHGGGINGFVSELAYYPDDSLTVAVLANTTPAPSEQIAENIARAALGMPFRSAPERPADLPIADDERTRLAGNYRRGRTAPAAEHGFSPTATNSGCNWRVSLPSA